jgi:hypothetical protein
MVIIGACWIVRFPVRRRGKGRSLLATAPEE